MQRERWGSRLLFIFAAVGSAAGLGNLWRFPYLAYKYGGGAFLFPYLVILLFVGIPLLLLEFSIGQRFQKGAIEGMYSLNRNAAGVGLMGVFNGFIITSYYSVVIAWAVLFLINSFKVAWAGNETSFFYEKVLNLSDSINDLGSVQWPILLCLIIVWLSIYFSIWQGTKSASKVVMITMPLPFLLVTVLALKGLCLGEGSLLGVSAYLVPDVKKIFLDREVWNAAIAQIFFTLTLGFGTMIAYGSYNDKKQELVKSTYWTVMLNSTISIIAGFAIFGTIGFMSYQLAEESGVPAAFVKEYQQAHQLQVIDVTDVSKLYSYEELAKAGLVITKKEVARFNLNNSKLAGPGLAFVVYPKAIAMFKPKWVAAVFGVLFFITLLSLGIDSAFSLVEAITTVIADEMHRRSAMVNRSFLALVVCLIGLLTGVIYTTRGGLYLLDVVDHYVTNYGLVFVGFMQVLIAGWFYNTMALKDYINTTTNAKLGNWWVISIKFIAPVVLFYLLINQLISDIKTPYEGYPFWAQFLGILIFVIPLLISVLFSRFIKMQRDR